MSTLRSSALTASPILAAGLVNRLQVAIAPILLGGGMRPWDGLRGIESGDEVTTEAAESGTVHITFTRAVNEAPGPSPRRSDGDTLASKRG